MVSRRKILSRSRDDLVDTQYEQEEEEDVWNSSDKLYRDHIQEVLEKWHQLDDEIWAKVIVFERNRRVAKAYARAPVLTINGCADGFDGIRIGLNGFENPMRDQQTETAKKRIGDGVKLKVDWRTGSILIRRYCRSNVYVKPAHSSENAIGGDIMRNSQGTLEFDKAVMLFDRDKYEENMMRETQRSYPDRRRLETQCLSAIVFHRSEPDLLKCPIWVLIINVIGLNLLKNNLPPVMALKRPVDIKNRPRIPIPDEDPYSVAGVSSNSGHGGGGDSSGMTREQVYAVLRGGQRGQWNQRMGARRSGEQPPKLPPRESLYGHDIPKMPRQVYVKPDYDDIEDDYMSNLVRPLVLESKKSSSSKKENGKKYDDPYYYGLSARVPNFVKKAKSNGQAKQLSTAAVSPANGGGYPQQSPPSHSSRNGMSSSTSSHHHHHHHHHPQQQPHHHASHGLGGYPISHSQSSQIYGHLPGPVNAAKRSQIMHHARSFESGLDSDDRIDSPYNHIYGRLPIPARGLIPPTARAMYISEWD